MPIFIVYKQTKNMKKLIHYILVGIVIILFIMLFSIIMRQPLWVLLLIIVVARYSDIKKFIKNL